MSYKRSADIKICENYSIEITILKDTDRFYGVNLEGCKIITNRDGNIQDVYTANAIAALKELCSATGETINILMLEIRVKYLEKLMDEIYIIS